METNADMVPSIRVMSELYDVGYKEAKPLKNKEAQTKEIKNLAVSALFIGSHENLLYDEKIKTLFKKEFSTKLARRSFFTFTPEEVLPPHYTSIPEMLKAEREAEELALKAREFMNQQSEKIANCNISEGVPAPLTVDNDAKDIYDIYLRYNIEKAKEIPKRFSISVLVRKHAQWRALKLAGAIAIFNCHKSITKQDLIYAISYVEHIDGDMTKFETELMKEKYEVFASYMKSQANKEGKFSITLHALKKLQYITGTSGTKTKMKELVNMASSYDPDGVYSVTDNKISYEVIVKSEITGASFVYQNGQTKDERKFTCCAGYEYQEVTFPQLSGLLCSDVAFSMFKFKTPNEGAKITEKCAATWDNKVPIDLGVRGRENITSGTTWLCYDIDNTNITIEEMHLMLEDVNHHLARTSDETNDKKYRLIIQMDASVDLDPIGWQYFIESVSDEWAIPIDKLPQSQIMYGYAGREVLSVIDQEPLSVKKHLTYAADQVAEKVEPKELTQKEKSALLSNKYTTLEWAFNAKHGEGSRQLYKAARYMHKLGATKKEIKTTIREISAYWDYPMPENRLKSLSEQIDNF